MTDGQWNSCGHGDYAAPLRLPGADASGTPPLAEADLRARIHAQQSRYAEAVAAWQRALEEDHGNASASDGIARATAHQGQSRPPRGTRLGRWFGVAAVTPIFAMALAFFAGRFWGGQAGVLELRAVQTATANEVASLRAMLENRRTGLAIPGPESATGVSSIAAAAIGNLTRASVAGVRLEAERGGVRIEFERRLFSSGGTDFVAGGSERLAAVATLLAGVGPQLRIDVTGTTDARLLRAGARWRDNGALALDRAAVAAE